MVGPRWFRRSLSHARFNFPMQSAGLDFSLGFIGGSAAVSAIEPQAVRLFRPLSLRAPSIVFFGDVYHTFLPAQSGPAFCDGQQGRIDHRSRARVRAQEAM